MRKLTLYLTLTILLLGTLIGVTYTSKKITSVTSVRYSLYSHVVSCFAEELTHNTYSCDFGVVSNMVYYLKKDGYTDFGLKEDGKYVSILLSKGDATVRLLYDAEVLTVFTKEVSLSEVLSYLR